ncbi:cytochrome P450 [Scleroderma yunnanense]
MEDSYGVYILASVCVALVAITMFRISKAPKLDHIPTVGSTNLLGTYWSGIRFSFNCSPLMREGYTKYKTGPFKVATLTSWIVVLNRNHADDVVKASEDVLSFHEATLDSLNTVYTLGPEIHHDPYHISVIRSQLTRSLASLYPDMRDELVASFSEILDLKDNEWKTLPAVSAMKRVICRTSHRVIVGLPLCRDPSWNKLNIAYVNDIFMEAFFLMLLPKFTIPALAKYVTNLPGRISTMSKYLDPIISERRKRADGISGEWTDKPNDFLQWCIDEGKETSVRQLAQRVLTLNFTSVHIFVQALCHLAANPQYAELLREEVEAVVHTDGWTKEAISKMQRIDSFLKESQRVDGTSIVPIMRKAMKDVTLTDGTLIPKGTIVCVPGHAVHHDYEVYENPEAFDPLRFVNLEDKQGGGNTRYQMVSVNAESLGFGLGRAACPGRFFATILLKSMLAHIVMSYDVKLEENATLPKSQYVGTVILANTSSKVMFRKRQN